MLMNHRFVPPCILEQWVYYHWYILFCASIAFVLAHVNS